jgi:apolipoprotein N-acyltransferase
LVFAPWLLLVKHAPTGREAAIRGWWGAVGFLLAVHYWLLPSTTLFLPVIAALLGLLWMPWAALARHLLQRTQSPWELAAAVAVVPAGWVLIEVARSWSALGGPWGLLGASQWQTPTMLAPASLGGVWLVSYLIVAANVAVLLLFQCRQLRMRALAAMFGLVSVAVGPAWYGIEAAPSGAQTVPVAVVEAGVVRGAGPRLAAEIAATDRLAPNRYRLVIWGESSVGFDLLRRRNLQRRLESVAGRLGADLLVNVDAAAPGGAIRKTAVLLDADGVLASYQKIRLVPFGEYIPMRSVLGWLTSFTKAAAVNRLHGSHLVLMHAGGLPFVPLICFESAFPDMSRAAARGGARLLVFQTATTTFQGSWMPDQHASLAAVRAVETGRPTVQASLAGTTAAFDAQGRRLMWHPGSTGVVAGNLPLAFRQTPFDRYGAWFPLTCLAAVAAVLTAAGLRHAGRRTGSRLARTGGKRTSRILSLQRMARLNLQARAPNDECYSVRSGTAEADPRDRDDSTSDRGVAVHLRTVDLGRYPDGDTERRG